MVIQKMMSGLANRNSRSRGFGIPGHRPEDTRPLIAGTDFCLRNTFAWKYTPPNRYASTTKILRSYTSNNELTALRAIKELLFARDKNNIEQCMAIAVAT
jgi:hypothetical protein